jgi:hypothetical protein
MNAGYIATFGWLMFFIGTFTGWSLREELKNSTQLSPPTTHVKEQKIKTCTPKPHYDGGGVPGCCTNDEEYNDFIESSVRWSELE